MNELMRWQGLRSLAGSRIRLIYVSYKRALTNSEIDRYDQIERRMSALFIPNHAKEMIALHRLARAV